MRHVELKGWSPPHGWQKRAKAAAEEVARASSHAERVKAIELKSDLWRELKDELEKFSHGKCWYCESRQNRSDNPVDHYRPKNRVVECPGHDGYWWLAFDWRNYRFSCGWCNSRHVDAANGTSGGKRDHFPLEDECTRAHGPQDSIRRELPLLLDPTVRVDASLLTFNPDGTPVPSYSLTKSPVFHRRALESIKVYHLHDSKLCATRIEVRRKVRELIERGSTYLDRYENTRDDLALEEFERAASELSHMLSSEAEYSRVAKAAVDDFFSTVEWLANLVDFG